MSGKAIGCFCRLSLPPLALTIAWESVQVIARLRYAGNAATCLNALGGQKKRNANSLSVSPRAESTIHASGSVRRRALNQRVCRWRFIQRPVRFCQPWPKLLAPYPEFTCTWTDSWSYPPIRLQPYIFAGTIMEGNKGPLYPPYQ